jgi:hypothetical protein
MNITDSDARFLVQLLTYHALLQREDTSLWHHGGPEQLMENTKYYADLFMKEVLNAGTTDK